MQAGGLLKASITDGANLPRHRLTVDAVLLSSSEYTHQTRMKHSNLAGQMAGFDFPMKRTAGRRAVQNILSNMLDTPCV